MVRPQWPCKEDNQSRVSKTSRLWSANTQQPTASWSQTRCLRRAETTSYWLRRRSASSRVLSSRYSVANTTVNLANGALFQEGIDALWTRGGQYPWVPRVRALSSVDLQRNSSKKGQKVQSISLFLEQQEFWGFLVLKLCRPYRARIGPPIAAGNGAVTPQEMGQIEQGLDWGWKGRQTKQVPTFSPPLWSWEHCYSPFVWAVPIPFLMTWKYANV